MLCFQVAAPLAPVRADQRRARAGELQGYDVQHRASLRHAHLCHHQHRLLQVEDEPGPGFHHVPPVLRVRSY